MAKILIIGCGDLGTAIAAHLQQNQHTVIGVRRSASLLPNAMQTIQADVSQPQSLAQLADLNIEIIIYCVSADAQTDDAYNAAYVQGLKNVLETQRKNTQLQHVFFVSSTRVYGQVTNDVLDENSPAIASDFGGERLLEAENILNDLPCNATKLRLSGIYAKGRLYLVNMSQDIQKWPAQNSWSNRIHRDDAAGFIAFLVEKVCQNTVVKNCYVVTDDQPTQQYTVLLWLAMQQKIDTSTVKIPHQSGGKRLSNKALRETGFVLQYPNYQAGYGQVLKNKA